MIYHLLHPYVDQWDVANLVAYISVRSAAAALTAFVTVLLIGPVVIRELRRRGIGEDTQKTDSDFLRDSHADKTGTPTMGGIMILIGILTALGLFANFSNVYVLLAYCATAGFGIIGFADDYIKLTIKDRKGLKAMAKIILQGGVALSLAYATLRVVVTQGGGYEDNELLMMNMPFLKSWIVDMGALSGIGFVLLGFMVVVGTSNGVNLSDGLDGLASGCVVMASLALAVIAYVAGRFDWSHYLHLVYVPGCGELAVVMSAVAGACLGFLWFNVYPARVFMGDTGSLPLGGLMGYVAVVSRHELTFLVVGGIFLAEVASVILQVGSFKLRGKRLFRIAPLHHHFERGGLHEVTVTVRFWIVGAILAALGVAMMKVR